MCKTNSISPKGHIKKKKIRMISVYLLGGIFVIKIDGQLKFKME